MLGQYATEEFLKTGDFSVHCWKGHVFQTSIDYFSRHVKNSKQSDALIDIGRFAFNERKFVHQQDTLIPPRARLRKFASQSAIDLLILILLRYS